MTIINSQHNARCTTNTMLGGLVFMAYVSGIMADTAMAQYGTENNTLKLTSVPSTATEGELFTMSCTSTKDIGAQPVAWFKDGDITFSTTHNASTNNTITFLPEGIGVYCDAFQHNITFKINSTMYNGSVWTCAYEHLSNSLTIDVETPPEKSVVPEPITSGSTTLSTRTMKHSIQYPLTDDTHITTMSHTTHNHSSAVKQIVGEGSTTRKPFMDITGTTTPLAGVKHDMPASQTDAYTIAGSVIGAFIAIAVVVVVVLCVRRKTIDAAKVMEDNFVYSMSSEAVPRAPSAPNSGNGMERAIMVDNLVYEGPPRFALDATKTEVTEKDTNAYTGLSCYEDVDNVYYSAATSERL
ncbi:uncharacterized protein LOC124114786 [Haliotis rufescens]|uniref:uncharacterized protein LOC124114786 n=1 Tax=Haliotis rufescens TaxID=6454 RepID=UPI001EB0A1DA|nr:uncharacterized protein LOC124114786 [Haliotis rufescens]